MSDTYMHTTAVDPDLWSLSGSEGVALTALWPNGKTGTGWGEDHFMQNYLAGAFRSRTVLLGYQQRKWNFAIIMRSVRAVCIDIDGKNDGNQGALALGMLPKTLAETSKSGNGYHLFYEVEDSWDDKLGFARLSDRIGLRQGVDLRGTGCVYHHPIQQWNGRSINKLPQHLLEELETRQQNSAAQITQITRILNVGDEEEVLVMQHGLVSDLKRDIPAGRRNTTLFAIGQQMQAAGVPAWDDLIFDRAIEVGLDKQEASKIVANVIKYGSTP